MLNRDVPDPFLAAHRLARAASRSTCAVMRLACDPLIGEHDFSLVLPRARGSRAGAAARPPLVRRVARGGLDRRLGDGLLRFEIRANAFCHQMVRSIVGLLVDVGRGRRRAGDVLGILRARDRALVGQLAPPHGLCLWEVGY